MRRDLGDFGAFLEKTVSSDPELSEAVAVAEKELEAERKTEAIGRLQAWVRDFGDQKQHEFIADLKTVLGMK